MTFTAAGIALSVETKATTDNNWQGVDQVSVEVGGEVKAYDVQSTAPYTTATLTSDNPFYWQNTAPIEVTAWWPTGDVMPQVVVKANQSEGNNYQASDYISATGTVQFGGSHDLQFTHRTAKVVVNPLLAGNDMTDDELAGATIALTGVSTGDTESATVTPYQNTTALLPEQQIAANEPFIRVTLAGGTTYSYKPDEAITLKAGYQYTYTITVNKTGLGMENVAISSWDNTTPAISGEAEPLTHTYDQATNTYTVYTAKGLLAWAAAAESDEETNCILAADIDMDGQSWTTISTSYRGTFDGAGHTISHISGGLFESVFGTVKNLTIQDASVSGSSDYTGMIAGKVYSGNIENCHVVGGKVTGNNFAGGIVGMIYSQATVRACSSSATVSGEYNVGGISAQSNGTILSCHATGTVTSTHSDVGAIAGLNGGAIIACYWSGASANGIGRNSSSSTSSEAEKTDNWQTAAEAMNNALPDDFGWEWQASDADTPPVMVKKE